MLDYLPDIAVWTFQGLILLEKELAYLGSVCAAALMKKDLALPIGMDEQICFSMNPWYKLCVTDKGKLQLYNLMSKSFIYCFNLYLF